MTRFSLPMILAAALAASSASAQQAPRAATPPAAAPAAEGPDRTLAVFADWTLRCETRAGTGNARSCEMAQTAHDQRQQPVAVLALGRLARGEPMRLVAQVPVNVQVAQPARLVLEGAGRQDQPLALAFRSCTPRGCFAELELRDEAVLRRLRARPAEAAGKLEWHDAAGGEAAIPVSFRGFTAAYEALGKAGE